jgi:hypothetical protein
MVIEGMKIMKYITNVSVMLVMGAFAVTGALYYMAMENAFAAVADNQSLANGTQTTTQTCSPGAQCTSESQSSNAPNNISGIHIP